jgi:hypothetical protein
MRPAYEWVMDLVAPGKGLQRLKKLEAIEMWDKDDETVAAFSVPEPLVSAFARAQVALTLQLRIHPSR